MKLAVGLVSRSLVSSAGITGTHIFIDHLSHPGPVEVPSNQFQGLFLSEMSCGGHIVVHSKDSELDVVGKAVELEHVFQIQASRLFRIDLGGRRTEMSHLGKAVHADEDSVATAGSGKFYNEIHGDRGPGSARDR